MPDAIPPDLPPYRRGRGAPAFTPTKEQRWLVQVLHAHGIPLAAITRNVRDDGQRIDVKTLKRAFKDELATAYVQVKAAMIAAVVRTGMQGNVTAQRFWLQTQGGPEWRVPWGYDRDGAAPIAASAGESGTTIIIKGGLPPIDYDAPVIEHEDIVPPQKTNGAGGNGRDHSD